MKNRIALAVATTLLFCLGAFASFPPQGAAGGGGGGVTWPLVAEGNITVDTDSTYNLGAAGGEWANLYVDTVNFATGSITHDGSNLVVTPGTGALSSPGAGAGSEVFGNGATSAGARSVAIGQNANAAQNDSVVIGPDAANTVGIEKVVIGHNAIGNSGNYGISIGSGASSGSSSVCLGYLATGTGTDSVTIGKSAQGTGIDAIAIGDTAIANGREAVCVGTASDTNAAEDTTIIGYAAHAHDSTADFAIVIGNGASTSATNTPGAIVIGASAQSAYAHSIVLGRGAAATKTQQFLVGDDLYPIVEFTVGNGGAQAAPQAETLWTTTNGSGTDVAATDLILSPGLGTGAGAPGQFLVKTGTTLGSGTTLQTATTRLTVDEDEAVFAVPVVCTAANVASYYFSTPAQTTLGVATPAKASGTTTSLQASGFTVTTSNRATYNGTTTGKFLVTVTVSLTASAATVGTIHLAENGTVVTGLRVDRNIPNTDEGAMAVSGVLELATNDYVELFVETDDGDELTIESGTVTVTPVN